MPKTPITRRDALRRISQISGGLLLTGAATVSPFSFSTARAATQKSKFLVEGLGQTDGYTASELTRKVFDKAGGIKRFVSRGDVVVIKPNISWARAPHLAASTNPQVLEAVIQLCQEAGAKKVRIADHTIHDARRCFAITGAGRVAKNTGADLVYPRSSLMKKMNIRGHRLNVWPVFTPLVEADKIINLPVAKHHSLSRLTLGMKNWIGAVGGSRWSLHQDIHQSIVDLARFFNPTLTLIDATRIMLRNGPSGGSTSDVVAKNRLILSDDPVAADAKAAEMFNVRPESLGFVQLAQKWGLGTYDMTQIDLRSVTV